MPWLCVYVLFDKKREPLVAGILNSETGVKKIYQLYGKGSGLSIHDIDKNKQIIAKTMSAAIARKMPIITSSFKTILSAFDIELVQGFDYNVYDRCWDVTAAGIDNDTAKLVVSKMLDRLAQSKAQAWQKIFANAAVVYQCLENRGVKIDVMTRKPIWAQTTYSGRSKNMVVNVQGADGTEHLMNPAGCDDDVHVYFDWVAADMRVASLVSGDEIMQDTFTKSDPYTALLDMLQSGGQVARSDCKQSLLQAINSFDYEHPILSGVYKGLGKWLEASKRDLEKNGHLDSILGRKFLLS